jgi:hypothetical protein
MLGGFLRFLLRPAMCRLFSGQRHDPLQLLLLFPFCPARQFSRGIQFGLLYLGGSLFFYSCFFGPSFFGPPGFRALLGGPFVGDPLLLGSLLLRSLLLGSFFLGLLFLGSLFLGSLFRGFHLCRLLLGEPLFLSLLVLGSHFRGSHFLDSLFLSLLFPKPHFSRGALRLRSRRIGALRRPVPLSLVGCMLGAQPRHLAGLRP